MPKSAAHSLASASLYRTEDEIAQLVLGNGAKDWSTLAAVWEREGLPPIDPMTGMRFWPSVERFLYYRHGLVGDAVPMKTDGGETWSK